MSELADIILKIHFSNITDVQDDLIVEKDLFSDISKLYIDRFDNKHYFFSEYICDLEGDNWNQIQKDTINNIEAFGGDMPKPSDSYLILLWKIDKIEEALYSKIIQIEENEFFYKKYVLYYTQEEYEALIKWLAENDNISIDQIIELLSQEREVFSLYAQLLIRILIKIPFFILNFPTAVLDDFNLMIERKIEKMRDSSKLELKEINKIVEKNNDAKILADEIFSTYLEEWS